MTYPSWICADCGEKNADWACNRIATFHDPDPRDKNDCCGWCGTTDAPLTEPRDYGYPAQPPMNGKNRTRKSVRSVGQRT